MNDVSIPQADPLLASVSEAHLALVRIVGDALTETGEWPVYQYVEARMDDLVSTRTRSYGRCRRSRPGS